MDKVYVLNSGLGSEGVYSSLENAQAQCPGTAWVRAGDHSWRVWALHDMPILTILEFVLDYPRLEPDRCYRRSM